MKRKFFTGAMLGVLALAGCGQKPEQDTATKRTFSYRSNHYSVHSEGLPWAKAEAFCLSRKGHLASIGDQAESEALARFLKLSGIGGTDIWIGLNDRDKEGDWRWTSGDAVKYVGWSSGEPNDSDKNEDCADWNVEGWNDIPCHVHIPFLCKRR
ncbi:MAG: C-type lectin domain-containing protein [Elusimicrobiota bacterium]